MASLSSNSCLSKNILPKQSLTLLARACSEELPILIWSKLSTATTYTGITTSTTEWESLATSSILITPSFTSMWSTLTILKMCRNCILLSLICMQCGLTCVFMSLIPCKTIVDSQKALGELTRSCVTQASKSSKSTRWRLGQSSHFQMVKSLLSKTLLMRQL